MHIYVYIILHCEMLSCQHAYETLTNAYHPTLNVSLLQHYNANLTILVLLNANYCTWQIIEGEIVY